MEIIKRGTVEISDGGIHIKGWETRTDQFALGERPAESILKHAIGELSLETRKILQDVIADMNSGNPTQEARLE